MPAEAWNYGLSLYGEDGTDLGQRSVTVDWGPATEWLRLQALRRGLGGSETFQFLCSFEPVWDPDLGAPYVEGFAGRLAPVSGGASVEHVFPLRYLGPKADEASQALVREGALTEGELFTYRGLAFLGSGEVAGVTLDASSTAVEAEGQRFSTRSLPPDVPVQPGVVSDRLAEAEVVGTVDPLDIPVLIPDWVLDEAADLAAEAGACETGGILIGHLRQDPGDPGDPEAFVEVTAQIPALGADADSSRLSFTPEVWSSVRAAIDLRASEEIMVAWWHSHPVHEWCKDCPPEKRAVCPLREDFLSSHDRLLHQTIFPRAYSTALVVNELGSGERTFSVFGPRDGRLEPRGYHRLPMADPSSAPHHHD